MAHAHHHGPILKRRTALLGMGAAGLSFGSMKSSWANTPATPRLIVINIRGGLDGLSAVTPYGDPSLARLRAPLIGSLPGQAGGLLDLDGFFAMHPALQNLHALYGAGEALVVHAVGNAGSSRSHFQGQDYLQAGEPLLINTGWLNRLANVLPVSQGAIQTLINMGLQTSLLVEGPAPTASWCQFGLPKLSAQIASRILQVTMPDPVLGPAAAINYSDNQIFSSVLGAASAMPSGLSGTSQLAWVAGDLMAAPNGPSIATITLNGVDTHADQVSRLNPEMQNLDLIFACLKSALGTAWKSTVILTMTEFGRTAAANGTGGTDHGTGFAVFLAGGAVAGGKVISSWPGLTSGQLYEGRDLQPTVDFRQVAASILSSHLKVPASALAQVFPAGYGALITGLTRN